ncbi:hypothetical protein [Anaerophilus nitritogenes]|uniref:hypothetical protein n=1 Tax=Anaerophilus nitritogenes TaxID=2498136 RepID=UPI00101C0017|nr:hypothetical protein [Anaerophilus nitritogenes]
MAEYNYTPNLNLKKPTEDAYFDVEDLNGNMDILDQKVGDLQIKPAHNFTSIEVNNLKSGKLANGKESFYNNFGKIEIAVGFNSDYEHKIYIYKRHRKSFSMFRLFFVGNGEKNKHLGVSVFGKSGVNGFHVAQGTYLWSPTPNVYDRTTKHGIWMTKGIDEGSADINIDDYTVIGSTLEGVLRGGGINEFVNKNKFLSCLGEDSSPIFRGAYFKYIDETKDALVLVFKTFSPTILNTQVVYEVF